MREAGSVKPLASTSKIATVHFVAAVADSYEDLVRAWFKQVDGSPGRLVSVRSVDDDSDPADRCRSCPAIGRGARARTVGWYPIGSRGPTAAGSPRAGRVRGGGHDGLIR